MTFRDSQEAFAQAIKDGRLSDVPNYKLLYGAPVKNYAGQYMYMGTDESGRDLFKNILTRKYDV